MNAERKFYIDNIRWMTVILVLVYHVVYIFNCSGVISNFIVQGIPQLDTLLIFLYPWFMSLLFVVAGISARYSLQKRSGKEFIKNRAKKILVPSLAGIFIIGWIMGWVTNQYNPNMFGGNDDLIPGFVKYLIYCLSGIGPLWFAHQLFIACLVLMLVRVIDKKDKLGELGKKANLPVLVLLVLPYWLSSMLFNTPLIEVYRHGFYIFSFLLGYHVFVHDEVLERLRKVKAVLLPLALVVGVIYTVMRYGENYTTQAVLQSPFTNVYAWLMILAILSWAKDALNFNNKFSRYMTKANFGIYVLHYPVLCLVAFVAEHLLQIPVAGCYIINLVVTAVLLPIVYEVLRRIPVIRFLLLGEGK